MQSYAIYRDWAKLRFQLTTKTIYVAHHHLPRTDFVSCHLIHDEGLIRGNFPLNQCPTKALKSPQASRKSLGNGRLATHPLRVS